MSSALSTTFSQEEMGYVPPSDSAKGAIRVGLMIIALFFGGFGGWAAFAPLNAAVVGDAVVKVEGNRKSVQQLDGGIVAEMRVADGDHVAKDAILMVLDDTEARAQFDVLVQQQDTLLAMQARLTAERDGKAGIDFPAELLAAPPGSTAAGAVESQRREFESRGLALAGQRQILEQRLSQLQDQVQANTQLLQTQKDQLQSIRDERSSLDELFKKGLVTKPRLLQLERTATSLEGQIASTQGNIAAGLKSIDEISRQIDQLAKDRLADITKEFTEVQSKLQELGPRILNARTALGRTEVRAPYAGTVVDLAVFGVGAVIGRGERLMDIVPDDAQLVVEAKVRVEDIADLAPGMKAEVHFTSYKQRITPLIHGEVTDISADRLTDPRTEMPYYVAQIRVDPVELARSPEIQLYPGMPATVMITTKARSALDYLVGPLVASFDRSFKER